jgi:alkylation response protein AidB-like acyl-CoA dehydrogenase
VTKMSQETSGDLVQATETFIRNDVLPYLAIPGNEEKYPEPLIQKMSQLGFLGMNIPEEYEGLALGRPDTIAVNIALGKGWLALGALLGTHLRGCFYFIKRGTEDQRAAFLPKMAVGQVIAAHAYHEQANRSPLRFRTTLRREGSDYILDGLKDWVTNARHADILIVIARSELPEHGGKPVAVIVPQASQGLFIGPELPRPGVKGVSLCSVQFNQVRVDPDEALIGGIDSDIIGFINTFKTASSLNFSARAVGAAESVLKECGNFLHARDPAAEGRDVIVYRFGEVATQIEAAAALLDRAVVGQSHSASEEALAYMAKVQATSTLQECLAVCMMLKGGAGYASPTDSLDRIYRDAASLPLIDTPNDVLLSRIGADLLRAMLK